MKRLFDIVVSLIGIIIFSPAFVIISILIKIKLGSPIFFYQKRPGLNGKIFKMVKFRTMLDKVDDNGNNLPDSLRLTKFGYSHCVNCSTTKPKQAINAQFGEGDHTFNDIVFVEE